MRRSTDRILVTHVGALPAPPDVWGDQEVDGARLSAAVGDVVAHQREAGVDFVNEGELTKEGNWVQFIGKRLEGYEPAPEPGKMVELMVSSADWVEFADYYQARMAANTLFEETGAAPSQTSENANRDVVCTGPITYCGEAALRREIDTLLGALGDAPASDAFLTTTAPTSVETGRANDYYASEEEYVGALAEALRVEYEAIAAAGLQVQLDDAWLAALWDRIGIAMGLDAYKKFCMLRVEAQNHALRNVPEEQIRYHMCWGSWHGPHSRDLPLPDVIDVLLAIKAQMYLFEAANVRHEHEAAIWETVKLPEGKILAPGVVSHATTIIEHPELVSHRIRRFANMVGRENVIASTDCGLGLRCHPQIAWAKLRALSEGAELASRALWGRGAV